MVRFLKPSSLEYGCYRQTVVGEEKIFPNPLAGFWFARHTPRENFAGSFLLSYRVQKGTHLRGDTSNADPTPPCSGDECTSECDLLSHSARPRISSSDDGYGRIVKVERIYRFVVKMGAHVNA